MEHISSADDPVSAPSISDGNLPPPREDLPQELATEEDAISVPIPDVELQDTDDPGTARAADCLAALAAAAAYDSEPGGRDRDSQSSKHHLLRHHLPEERRGLNAVAHFAGCDTIRQAVRKVQRMAQRELQQAFQLVYGTVSYSNNNNWLRKKLIEALTLNGRVPADDEGDSESSPMFVEQVQSKPPTKKQRRKPPRPPTADGQDVGGYTSSIQTQSYLAPKSTTESLDEERKIQRSARPRRGAAAGVGAATAALLNDPDFDQIDRELELERARKASRMYSNGQEPLLTKKAKVAHHVSGEVSAGAPHFGQLMSQVGMGCWPTQSAWAGVPGALAPQQGQDFVQLAQQLQLMVQQQHAAQQAQMLLSTHAGAQEALHFVQMLQASIRQLPGMTPVQNSQHNEHMEQQQRLLQQQSTYQRLQAEIQRLQAKQDPAITVNGEQTTAPSQQQLLFQAMMNSQNCLKKE